MILADLGNVPLDCHGSRSQLLSRIKTIGAAGVLAFDGARHVGQLQFRVHDPRLRSARGIWDADYWGDFGQFDEPLPARTLGIFCYHVGQTAHGVERAASYSGQGMATAMLDYALDWASLNDFGAVVAKGVPANPGTMRFMGGLPTAAYEARGFRRAKAYNDPQLAEELIQRAIVSAHEGPGASSVSICVKRLT